MRFSLQQSFFKTQKSQNDKTNYANFRNARDN